MKVEKGREILALLLLGLSAFVVTSLATYDADDYAANVFPHAEGQVANRCGVAGAVISYHLFHWFGPTAYLLLGLVFVWAGVLFFRAEIDDLPSRLIGTVLLVVSASALASLSSDGPSSLWPSRGGILGIGICHFLTGKFSRLGSYLVLSIVAILSLVLATDTLLFTLAARAGTSGGASLRLALHRLATRYEAWRARRTALHEKRREERAARLEEERLRREEAEAASRERYHGEVAELSAERDRLREERNRQAESQRLRKDEERQRKDEEKARRKAEKKGRQSSTSLAKVTEKITKAMSIGSSPELPVAPAADDPDDNHEPLAVPPPPPGSPYALPHQDLLEEPERVDPRRGQMDAQEKARILEETLTSFRIDSRVVNMERGPIVTQYEIEIEAGTKVSAVTALSNDLAMALKAPSIRIQAPIPGKGTIGVEVPNVEKEIVRVKDLLLSRDVDLSRMTIPLFLGKMADGLPLVPDLVKMPHLLIAGTTGSGKSVCINTIVSSVLLLRDPSEVKVILIDPKMVELAGYKNLPHLLTPVVTEMNRASAVLDWSVEKMEERYRLLKDVGCRNLKEYNALSTRDRRRRLENRGEDPDAFPEKLPYLVIVIDELADLMMIARKEVENSIIRLAQKARAIGIHLILATQRPSADVITGLIKSNMPSRIAFRVNAKGDSRIILDFNGAEKLLGGGDMLFLTPGTSQPIRCQGAYLSDKEIRGLIQWTTAQASPDFSPELERCSSADIDPSTMDEHFDEAVRIILQTRRGSATLLQRRFEIGYSRASRLIDSMEDMGIVGPHRGSKSREILMTLEDWEALHGAAAE